MAKRTRYSEYHDRYAIYRLELSDDGILFMQCHTNGGSLVWDWRAPHPKSDAVPPIARGPGSKGLIHTRTRQNHKAKRGRMPKRDPPHKTDYPLPPRPPAPT